MRGREIVLFAFVLVGVAPLFAIDSADFDENYIVDFNDFSMFSNYWLYDYFDNQRCDYWDLVVNGVIDFYDLDEIAEYWLVDYDFEDFSDFGKYWRRVVDYRFQDERFDLYGNGLLTLSGDGFVNFGDFSVFSSQWKKKTDCCDDLNSIPNPFINTNWEIVNFTGIYPACGIWDCVINDEYFSDPCYDGCGHNVIEGCQQTQEFDYYCAFNYRYGGQYGYRVGLCVYDCGRNSFEIIKNKGKCRMIMARHRTRDIPPQDPEYTPGCDEGTQGRYNWQVVLTDLPTLTKLGFCRESYTKPSYEWGWQTDEGEEGPCKLRWW